MLCKTAIEVKGLPSTAGKFAKNATKAGGVAVSISSNALDDPPPAIPTMGVDNGSEATRIAEVVFGVIAVPTVKKG